MTHADKGLKPLVGIDFYNKGLKPLVFCSVRVFSWYTRKKGKRELVMHPIPTLEFAKAMTTEDFDHFALSPQNIMRHFELLDGEMSEKMVAHPKSSIVAGRFSYYLNGFIIPNKLGYVTIADGGYQVGKHRLMPDVAYIQKDRYVPLADRGYQPVAPDLAVEVISPTDKTKDVLKKVTRYVENGTTVWLVDIVLQTVTVYNPNKPIRTYTVQDTLDGSDVLPNFTLHLALVFED
jgi:Uma2 family endonuclease